LLRKENIYKSIVPNRDWKGKFGYTLWQIPECDLTSNRGANIEKHSVHRAIQTPASFLRTMDDYEEFDNVLYYLL